MQVLRFPSAKAARHFVEDARTQGYRVHIPTVTRLLPRLTIWAIIIGALVGGSLLGIIGALAEAGQIGLPRLEPLFASPVGAVTALLAFIGGSLGALIGGFIGLNPVTRAADYQRGDVVVKKDPEQLGDEMQTRLEQLTVAHGGRFDLSTPIDADLTEAHTHHTPASKPTLNRVSAWVTVIVTAGILIQATSYIWFLSMAYGTGSDQQTRIGYTMKNVQRVPADEPQMASAAIIDMVGGPAEAVPADPIAAAIMAPVVAARGRTLAYFGDPAGPINLDGVRELAAQSDIAIIIAENKPAYALPAAYAAAFFRVPVVPLSQAAAVLDDGQARLLLVAAPESLIPQRDLMALDQFGTVERVAEENIHRHALRWARERWGDFGWGIDERVMTDGYFRYALTNPADPDFAAAGLPLAYLGNFGPLLYTPHDDLDEFTGQYLWRVAPDYFVIPSDGPFMNIRVIGGPESVSYEAQARADLALETHSYRNKVAGAAGSAIAGWMWFFPGLVGFIWALFAMPRRLPDTGFYPRLYWPLAMLVLGPLGILLFHMVYRGRPVEPGPMMPTFVRPPWAQAVSATIMGMGIGMALMIASMYVWEYFGLPIGTGLMFTRLQWLGAPMDAFMWVLMVIPAMIISAFLFMGPMLSEMRGRSYWRGVLAASPIVFFSMTAASIGMFTLSYWTMNWEELMAGEDLWLWVTPLWLAAAVGFFTALIPNYIMVRAGWKMGDM